ncbi:MAG: hypothetical protein FWH18_11295 [Marinilabiliaceae bacterium]|nr:hypothetical protein [Marinilabiliaceae bacterium]
MRSHNYHPECSIVGARLALARFILHNPLRYILFSTTLALFIFFWATARVAPTMSISISFKATARVAHTDAKNDLKYFLYDFDNATMVFVPSQEF